MESYVETQLPLQISVFFLCFFSGGFFCSSVCVFASSFLLPVKSSLHFLEVPVQWGRGGPLGP